MNTNFTSASQTLRNCGKQVNFAPGRTTHNEANASSGIALPATKKFSKSASFSPKLNNPSSSANVGVEKSLNAKSAPATPASTGQIAKFAPAAGSISVQAAGKLFSYKEVALAPPGTIVKAVAEQLPKGNLSIEQNSQVIQEMTSVGVTLGEASTEEDIQGEKIERPTDEAQVLVTEDKSKISASKEHNKVEGRVVIEAPESGKLVLLVGDMKVEATSVDVKNIVVSNTEAEAGKFAVLGDGSYVTSNDPKDSSSKSEQSIALVLDSHSASSPDSELQLISTENAIILLEKEESNLKIKVAEEVGTSHDLTSNDLGIKPAQTEEKPDEAETAKETTKKLSAAAPPFNPSMVPVFGSVPGFKEHCGILPAPVNIPPMITVNPLRRSPHQSATARVPYGPRLSGGCNRSGNRLSRNKSSYHSSELTGDGNHFVSPPIIMNPLAAEFVPGQPWVPNSYPVSPNGLLASPHGYPLSPNGIPSSPNGYLVPLNGTSLTQYDFPATPISSVESTFVNVETGIGNSSADAPEEGNGKSSTETGSEELSTEQKPEEDQPAHNTDHNIEEKHTDIVHNAGDSGVAKDTSTIATGDKQTKCWGDYSDSEPEIIEVTS